MLARLFIKNVAIIEQLDIELGRGFNVLTGETGAGKSIIIDAVNLILGERASRELIKYGADKASVEAVFDLSGCDSALAALSKMEIDTSDPEETVISRELSASGKNVCRINGTLVNLASLKSVTDNIVDVHGQHEHQSLLNPQKHIDFLDSFARGALNGVKSRVASLYDEYRAIRNEKLSGFGSEEERAREMDILAFQIQEINAAELKDGEEERLNAELSLLANAEKIMNALSEAHQLLSGDSGARTGVDGARRAMAEIASFSTDYEEIRARLDDIYYSLEDAAVTVRDNKNSFEFDPARLNAIEDRLELISNLEKKYGGSILKVLEFRDRAAQRLDMLKNADERQAELDKRLSDTMEKYDKAAHELTVLRRDAAAGLTAALYAQLGELGLEKAKFEVDFSTEGVFTANGADRVEFLLTTNPGEPLKALAKVASGGEMSRIMLAFKALFADNDEISTLIFDEIDTGISGRVAGVVGDKMVKIADSHQVICITHLPQIAALADRHYLVEKSDDGERTTTGVRLLGYEDRCRQVAAMMDGNPDSQASLNHARELIDALDKEKNDRRKKE